MIFVASTILLWFLAGWLIARYLLSIQEWLLIIPVSMGLGSVIYFFFLNILLRFMSVPLASILSSGLPLAFGIYWGIRRRNNVPPMQLSCSKQTAFILLILWIASAGYFYGLKTRIGITDEVDFAPRATMIGQAGLPANVIQHGYADTKLYICEQYHYAEAAVVGALTRQSGIQHLSVISDIRVTYNMTVIMGLCFNFLWFLLKRKKVAWAVIGAVLFVSSGSGQWLAEIHAFEAIDDRLPQNEMFYKSRETESFIDLNIFEAMKIPYVPPDLMVSLVSYMGAHNPVGFWVLGFLVLLGWFNWDRSRHGWLEAGILGIGAASSALYFTTGMLLLVLPLGLFYCWELFISAEKKSALKNLFAYSVLGLIVIFFQGGLITNSLFCGFATTGEIHFLEQYLTFTSSTKVQEVEQATIPVDTNSDTTGSSFSIGYFVRSQAALGFDSVNLLNPKDWFDALLDWGFGLPLYIVMFIYVIRLRNPRLILLFFIGGLSILLPFSVVPVLNRFDVSRFAVLPIWLGCACSVLLFAELWDWGKLWQRVPIRLLIIFLIVGLVLIDAVFASVNFRLTAPAVSRVLDPIDYTVQATWFGEFDPFTEKVWSPRYQQIFGHGKGTARAIMVFGTYGDQNSAISLPDMPDYALLLWEVTGKPEHLNLAGYDYLYVDEVWYSRLGDFQKGYLNDPAHYELLESWQDSTTGAMRWLYHTATNGDNSDRYYPHWQDFQDENWLPTADDMADYIPSDAIVFSPSTKEFARLPYIFGPAPKVLYEDGMLPDRDAALRLAYVIRKTSQQDNLDANGSDLTIKDELDAWRISKDPQHLREVGVDYIFVDANWIGATSEAEYATLTSPENYELVEVWRLPSWGFEMNFFYLFRVITP